MTTTNTYGRQVVVPLTNKSGGGVIAGDVVVVGTANNDAFTTTTSAAFTGTVGIAQETIADNAIGRVLLSGYAPLINTTASVTRQNFGTTSTTVKKAVDAGSSRTVGTFVQFLTGGTTPDGIVYPADLGSSSGSMATDALWDAAGDLAQGTGANTGAKLSAGAADTVLVGRGAGVAVAWAAVLPWTVDVDVMHTAITTTNWDTLTNDTAVVHAFRKSSTGAQNAEMGWDIVLAAGTWTIRLIHMQDTDRGIYTFSFDGVSVGTIDGYAGGTTRNTRSTITGIVVAASAKIRVTVKMATKNASSSSYFGTINGLRFERTA